MSLWLERRSIGRQKRVSATLVFFLFVGRHLQCCHAIHYRVSMRMEVEVSRPQDQPLTQIGSERTPYDPC